MDIITPTFTKASAGMSLSELRQLKADWLTAARDFGYLETCRLIARTLGKPFEIKNWRTWQGWRWNVGGLTVELFEGLGAFLPYKGDFDHIRVINVFVDGRKVVYYRASDDPTQTTDNVFIPGAWVDTLLEYREKAQETERGRSLTLVEKERRALLDQLLVGLEI